MNNHIELIKFFLTKNPKIGKKNIYGKTPRDLASNQEIKNILDNYINKKISKGNRTIRSNSKTKKIKVEPGQNKYKKLIETSSSFKNRINNYSNHLLNTSNTVKSRSRSGNSFNKINTSYIFRTKSKNKEIRNIKLLNKEFSRENSVISFNKWKKH